MRTVGRGMATLGVVAATGVLGLLPASAAPPSAMDGPVEDRTGALTAAQVSELEQSRDRVVEQTDYDLWVVYVDAFDGMDAYDWANDVALDSGAGDDVLLLAVAVQESDFALSVSQDAQLTDAQITDIEQSVDDELLDGDLAGAATSVADAIIEFGRDDGGPSILPWVIGGAIALLVWILVAGIRKVRRRNAADESAQVSTAALAKRAGSALVELDNDVRSSANELSFAQAQFGLEATKDFQAALTQAQATLQQAFEIQRGLDTGPPSRQQQDWGRILELCQAADAALDAQTEALDQLRAMRQRAPQLLAELEQRAEELQAGVAPARAALSQLGATYPATALTTVSRSADQAQALLTSAKQAVAEGRSRLQADDRGSTVAYARTAEAALEQVAQLLAMASNAGAALADAAARLEPGITSLSADITDAGRLAPPDAVSAVVQRAQAAIAGATEAKTGGDPIAALTELTSSEQALDAALASYREAEEASTRARTNAAALITQAEAAVRQADQFIDLNRGVVGQAARSRLASAQAALEHAKAALSTQPDQAAASAQRAITEAQTAQQRAASDMGPRGGERIPGGGYYGRSGGVDLESLILGGLLGQRYDQSRYRGQSRWGGSPWGSDYLGTGNGSDRNRSGWGGSSSRSSGWGGSSSSRSTSSRRRTSMSRSTSRRRSSSGGSRRRSGGGSRRRR
ncbi:MAG: TPM domain-containing protein [Beutenbergiaceae bacterium]